MSASLPLHPFSSSSLSLFRIPPPRICTVVSPRLYSPPCPTVLPSLPSPRSLLAHLKRTASLTRSRCAPMPRRPRERKSQEQATRARCKPHPQPPVPSKLDKSLRAQRPAPLDDCARAREPRISCCTRGNETLKSGERSDATHCTRGPSWPLSRRRLPSPPGGPCWRSSDVSTDAEQQPRAKKERGARGKERATSGPPHSPIRVPLVPVRAGLDQRDGDLGMTRLDGEVQRRVACAVREVEARFVGRVGRGGREEEVQEGEGPGRRGAVSVCARRRTERRQRCCRSAATPS